mmetsp:Transcript_34384/g.74238  ORF Transcript_34384/g.74238 Transcript_34384/m.74238 type:complete len:131 (+) Transcript_34384:427-819(+)
MFDMCTFSEGMVGVFSYGGSAKMKLHDCQITNCRHVGVQAAGGQMEANLSNVVGSKDVGLLVRGDNTHVKFSMCKILDSGTWGVQTFGGSKCTLFESQVGRVPIKHLKTNTSFRLQHSGWPGFGGMGLLV